VFGSHDGEAAFFSGGRAGAFGELPLPLLPLLLLMSLRSDLGFQL